TTSGKERGVENPRKRENSKDYIGSCQTSDANLFTPINIARGPKLHEHGMEHPDANQPWDQRRVFNRIPGPVATPAERFVSPPTSEHDSEPEYHRGKQCPGECNRNPSLVLLL